MSQKSKALSLSSELDAIKYDWLKLGSDRCFDIISRAVRTVRLLEVSPVDPSALDLLATQHVATARAWSLWPSPEQMLKTRKNDPYRDRGIAYWYEIGRALFGPDVDLEERSRAIRAENA